MTSTTPTPNTDKTRSDTLEAVARKADSMVKIAREFRHSMDKDTALDWGADARTALLESARLILNLLQTGGLRKALAGFDDDYMTSENHHPGYVLIPTAKFDEIRAALQTGEQETGGWVLVPREPTEEMLQPACQKHPVGKPMRDPDPVTGRTYEECPGFDKRRRIWASMLAAAPPSPDSQRGADNLAEARQLIADLVPWERPSSRWKDEEAYTPGRKASVGLIRRAQDFLNRTVTRLPSPPLPLPSGGSDNG